MSTSATTIDAFLASVAAKQPTPGGGAVAALVGATAAAIGEMVLNYSIGRKATPQFDLSLTKTVHEWSRARGMLLELMIEDQQAFAELTAAKKQPDSNEKEAAVAAAAEACIAVPRSIVATALVILERANTVVEQSNQYLLSDLAVCAELAMATLRAAIHCVRVNLPDQSAAKRAAISAECDAELARGVMLVKRTVDRIATLLAHG